MAVFRFLPLRAASVATALAATFAAIVAAPALAADSYPSRPIRMIVAYPTGGISDAVARALGEKLSLQMGTSVVVENKAGAGGSIGIDAVAKEVIGESGIDIEYLVGTMIELPRAALRAHVIAESADFFSFGTNDLTQTTFGISRDDAAQFLNTYIQKGIIEKDPFVSLDFDGVGELIQIAAERGRRTKNGLKLGICGEHGGDPESIRFCEETGLDYVSCSPFRVPIARLAAAQAAINGKG